MKKGLWGLVLAVAAWGCCSASVLAYHVEDVPYEYKTVVKCESEYYTYDEMMDDIELLARKHGLETRSLGRTAAGREVMYLSYGQGDMDVFVSAGIHGREYYNPYLLMRLLEEFLVDADDEMAEEITLHVVPMINPDGVSISQMGEAAVPYYMRETLRTCYENDRKHGNAGGSYDQYLKKWKANALGVDLNRNFPVGFGGYGSKKYQSSTAYKGEEALDQVESKAVADILNLIVPEVYLSFHSYGQIYFNGYTGHYNTNSKKLGYILSNATGYEHSGTNANGGMLEYALSLNAECAGVTLETGKVACPFSNRYGNSIYRKNKKVLNLAIAYGLENITTIEAYEADELMIVDNSDAFSDDDVIVADAVKLDAR